VGQVKWETRARRVGTGEKTRSGLAKACGTVLWHTRSLPSKGFQPLNGLAHRDGSCSWAENKTTTKPESGEPEKRACCNARPDRAGHACKGVSLFEGDNKHHGSRRDCE
jgi:hypothetical protein